MQELLEVSRDGVETKRPPAGKQGMLKLQGAARETPDFAARSPSAVVCVATFRRPDMLRQTLDSLVAQTRVGDIAVIVVDNDANGRAGAAVADEVFSSGALSGLCVVEATPGHCSASNRALFEARTRFPSASYILMIDDDEIADPLWVERMIAAVRKNNVDVVGGPVLPEFPGEAVATHRRHPIYWPAYDKSGPVRMIYGSGNFLIRRDALARLDNPQFDLRYNFLGGGDTDFFTRCQKAGLTSYWENDARIFETITPDRLETAWIVRRSLRIGAINYRLDRDKRQGALGTAWLAAKNAALLPVSAMRSLKLALRGEPLLVWAHPTMVAVGRLFAWAGIEPEQYRFKAP